MTFEDRETFMIERGLSEEDIFQDDFAREYYYEIDEDGTKEKVYLEDVILGSSSDEEDS